MHQKAIRRLLFALDIGDYVALLYLSALLGINFNKLATQCSLHLDKLAPRSLYPAEGVAFLIFFSDEGLNRGGTLALAIKLPEDLSLNRCYDSVGLRMFEGANLLGSSSALGMRVWGSASVNSRP